MFPAVPPIHFPPPDPALHAIQTVPPVQVAASINAQVALQIDLFSRMDGVYLLVANHSISTTHHRLASLAIPVVQAVRVQDLAVVLRVQVRHKFSMQDHVSKPNVHRPLMW